MRGLELELEERILRAKRLGCLFVRKMAPTCDLRCFAASGFERFQCAGKGRSKDASQDGNS